MDLGYAWLKAQLGLPDLPLPHASRRGPIKRLQPSPDGYLEDFPPGYVLPDDSIFEHLEFALKYDGINLPVLWHTMRAVRPDDLIQYLRENPGGKYARMMGFFFEMLTQGQLNIDFPLSGAYVLVADPEQYITSEPVTVAKWRLRDNLLGDARFCPIIERTPELVQMLRWSPQKDLDRLKGEYSPDLFLRAASWLYLAETKSSNEIEQEHPSPNRKHRFVQLLRAAGTVSLDQALTEDTLSAVQEAVVDPQKRTYIGFRGIQNFLGPPHIYGAVPPVDYPCPPPDDVPALMGGLARATERCSEHALLRAAVASFGLVFIHPFEDGNGRVSRYLIHDMLTRDGFTPKDFIFPVSAVMLQKIDAYKHHLELYSKPIRKLSELEFDEDEDLHILNPDVVRPLYRYPNLTKQTAFLYDATRACAEVVVVEEMDTLRRFEQMRLSVREVIDLPDRRLNELIGLIHQNGGTLSGNKRKSRFPDLSDEEIAQAAAAYEEAFRDAERIEPLGPRKKIDPEPEPGMAL